jgi:hypothetical protein
MRYPGLFNDFNCEAIGQDYRADNFVTTLSHAANRPVQLPVFSVR